MIENHILNRSIPIPLYYQLKNIITSEIESGNYPPGTLLPTEEQLIAQFNVSRTTVRQAITELVHEGRLYRIKSKGTFVAERKLQQSVAGKTDFCAEIQPVGTPKNVKVLDFRIGAAPANVASALSASENASIIFLQCKYTAANTTVMLQKDYFPSPAFNYILKHDFSTETVLDALSAAPPQQRPHHAKNIVECIKASSAITKHLNVKSGDPILLLNTTMYTIENVPVCYQSCFYRADSCSLEINTLL